jgi:hypothetical protein
MTDFRENRTMPIRWMALAVLMAAPIPLQGQALAELGFLRGCWRGPAAEGMDIEETWTAADADVMLATTRYLRDGRVEGWEFSRIQADSSGVHLTPYPDGRPAAVFALDRAERGMAIFANPQNDFPQTIVYRGDGRTQLLVRLEGSGRTMEWRMAAGACATPDYPPAPPAPNH